MAAIPCPDFVTDPAPVVPARITCTNRTCIENRFVAFVFSIDLAYNQHEQLGAGIGAWSLWDLPVSHTSQIDDDRGEDLIVVSIMDKLYWLDYTRYKDEWDWNTFAPIYRMLRIGPIPYNEQATEKGGYDLDQVKRFREFQWSLADGATGAAQAIWTVRVVEFQREAATTRSTTRRTNTRMRAQIATKGKAFIVTLEHQADEPINITDWVAKWDVIGRRIRESGIA